MVEKFRRLHGYVSNRPPYIRAVENRTWLAEIDGSDGRHDGGPEYVSGDTLGIVRTGFEVASIARITRSVPRIDSTGGA